MRWQGRAVTVLGAGRSGLAAARALSARGARVFLSEAGPLPAETRRKLADRGVRAEAGGHSARALEAELLVISPGVPWQAPLLRAARARGIPIWGELELGWRLCPSRRVVAVTGTNGKSTTTRLIGALLESVGLPVVVGGNLGPPLCALLEQITPATWVVLEVSSFQLESVRTFRPRVGVWLNLAPDHLDRHGDLHSYRALKARLFARQTAEDWAVLGPGLELPPGSRARVRRFRRLPARGPWRHLAAHVREDLAAARTAARLVAPRCTLTRIDVPALLTRPHCLEPVAEVEGVRFIDDSKATNPHAVRAALAALAEAGPLCFLLGGCPKGTDPAPLARALARADQVAQVIGVGPFATYWEKALREAGFSRFVAAEDFAGALAALAPEVRTCVLSPGGSSFDRFSDYRERGRAFRHAVAQFREKLAKTSTISD